MITDMNARVAMAQKLSIPQLQQAIKNGTVPAYVGVPLLQDKMRQQQQMAMAQQGQQQQQPPIAEQIMAEASRGGVDQLPSNLPIQNEEDEEGYAGGGIIAFSGDRTSDVRDPDRRSPSERALDELIARINSSGNNNTVIPPAANTGIAGAAPEVFPVDGVSPEFGGSTITADQDAARVAKIQAERAAAEDAQRQAFLRTAAPQMARPEAESPTSGSLTEGLTPADVARTEAQLPRTGTPSPKAPPSTGIVAPKATTTAAEAAPAPMSALDQYAAMLMEERKGIAKDRQQAKAMALLQTGLGIAGGTSPNPFANISQGALQGTQAYQQEMRGIRKEDADRLKQLMSLGIGKEKLALEARKLGIEDRKVDAFMARIGAGSEDRASQRAFENQRRYGQLYEVALKNREASIAKAYPMGELSPPINGMSYSQAMAAARNDPALRQYQKMAFPELDLSEPTAPKSDFSGFSLVPPKK
jgi:hypothetical protein